MPKVTAPGFLGKTLECISLWTVILRHETSAFSFRKTWNDYKDGFGTKLSDYYLGNFLLYIMTKSRSYILRVDFYATNGRFYSCEFSSFSIADETKKFKLTVGQYEGGSCGPAGLVNEASGEHFSTFDNDNSGNNCTGDIFDIFYA